MRFTRDGDTVVVDSMDRLARKLDDLRSVVQTPTNKGVRVEFVKAARLALPARMPLCTADPRRPFLQSLRRSWFGAR